MRTDGDGLPQSLRVRGRWAEVTSISDRWRIDDEWWRDRQVSRMYYECVLGTGRPIIIFQDLVGGGWFTHQ